ncbi:MULTISPECIES: ABC transporter ATP-binding protein [Deinococcus]|uniref:ABC transporter ATP-binding protein n=1 Tax=Deinococcus soli (ex Cha et al. 2016) TaxID=1309411 RepID=A0A0F7JNV1_9DEIO|nr:MULTISPECIES: ABC transporter ATP-binding protein [Deinococcus]AKH16300.1 ABC transporter ATP-binding protein [Deinococcus soli (ex Cha et al. 2016)]MDK2010757.1 ABC transporter ATP-binding protein [Deinococcus sp. 43]
MAAPVTEPAAFAVQLRDVWLRLGREVILRGVTLDVPAGQGVTLLGENGAGKTTLLRLLSAGLRPTRGEGRVLGFDLRDSRGVRDAIHLMPVDGGLYPDLTAAENLAFALRMHARTGDVPGALRRVGLEGAATRRARFLSAGMRKRLALARAHLLARPVTLVDEPFANLDDAGRALVQELLLELRGQGCSLLIAAHEPALAQVVAPRTLRLAGGLLHEEVPA